MAKKNKKPTVAEANRVYFLVLANTRGSLSMFPALAGPILFVLVVVNVSPLNAPSTYKGYEVLSFLAGVNVVIIWICAFFLILSMFKKLTYRFQVFSSTVMAGMAVGLVYTICLMTLTIATLHRSRGEQFYATLFNVVGLVAVALVAGATVVHVLLLRRRLRVGHSEKRTIGNYLAVSGSNRSKMFWIIVGAVAVVPNVLTQGQYLTNSFGVLALIFFAFVMPSLQVEFAYLAYLKSKDRVYWEKLPRRSSKKERLGLVRKVVMWVLGIIAAIALIWVLNIVLPMWL
jgi:hypothetical protein